MDAAEERRFREFVSARAPALTRLAYLLTEGDQHSAEDLLQTALAKHRAPVPRPAADDRAGTRRSAPE